MRSLFSKENLKPAVILTAIVIAVAALVGTVNFFTHKKSAFNEEQKIYDSLRVVIDGDFKPQDVPKGAPESVLELFRVTREDKLVGHAVTLSVQGYAGKIGLTVGIDAEGKVIKAVITSQSESHGKAGMSKYTDNFVGTDKDTAQKVDTFSGATVSSSAIKKAIIDAVNTVSGNIPDNSAKSSSQKPSDSSNTSASQGYSNTPDATNTPEEKPFKTKEEILALASEMLGKETALEDLTPENAKYVKYLFGAGDDGYIVYAVVISSNYGTVETETLFRVGNDGKIKNVKKMTWKTSDAMYGYVPPNESTVDAFYERLIGKSLKEISSFEKADLVSNATNTSGALKDAITEGLEAVNNIESGNQDGFKENKNYTARIVGITLLAVMGIAYAVYKALPIIRERRGKSGQ